MWESPIELQFGISDMVSEFIKGQTEQTEKYIVKSVQSVGIKIDKDELIKAINYDRKQYEKGYLDGFNADRWISVDDKLPNEQINKNTQDFEYVLCATTFGDIRPYKYGKQIGHEKAHFWNGPGIMDEYVTHWMPKPEMPKS